MHVKANKAPCDLTLYRQASYKSTRPACQYITVQYNSIGLTRRLSYDFRCQSSSAVHCRKNLDNVLNAKSLNSAFRRNQILHI